MANYEEFHGEAERGALENVSFSERSPPRGLYYFNPEHSGDPLYMPGIPTGVLVTTFLLGAQATMAVFSPDQEPHDGVLHPRPEEDPLRPIQAAGWLVAGNTPQAISRPTLPSSPNRPIKLLAINGAASPMDVCDLREGRYPRWELRNSLLPRMGYAAIQGGAEMIVGVLTQSPPLPRHIQVAVTPIPDTLFNEQQEHDIHHPVPPALVLLRDPPQGSGWRLIDFGTVQEPSQ